MARPINHQKPYPPEFRREAVELLRTSGRPLAQIGRELGVPTESLRLWRKQAEIDAGEREGLTSEEREELRRLRHENRILKKERDLLVKSRGLLREGERDPVTVFRFIEAERADFPISLCCRMLGVSRSGFHAWRGRVASQRSLDDAWLVERIRAIHERSRRTHGSPRIHAELRRQGVRVGRKRIERLMRAADLSGLITRRRRGTTIRVQGVRVADDLVGRDFSPTAPNRLWCADLKQIPTREGVLYLGSVLDCFSRSVVGWSMRSDMKAELVVDALEMAVERRRPDPGLVHHSDQGSQYISLVFGQRCRQAGIAQSMGAKGDCYDNAVKESFFASLEKDLLRRRSFRTRQEARTEVFDYVEVFYNRERLHSTLGYRSPEEYELDHERRDCQQQQETTFIQEERRAA